ncbi:hypothetical protein PRVXT_000934 [Proteinivorax tanatarense]|uniref:Uncharacterized protein n=1 Tax=Proteinivorax tanatarense TaxID=1260629 RepID=A0AAU7VPW4_9FIRM
MDLVVGITSRRQGCLALGGYFPMEGKVKIITGHENVDTCSFCWDKEQDLKVDMMLGLEVFTTL